VTILTETPGVNYKKKKKTSLACLDENEKYIFYKKYILYPIGPDR
jgi:hypothetical protein